MEKTVDETRKPRRKKRTMLLIGACIAAVLAIITYSATDGWRITADTSAQEGSFEGTSREEIQQELDRIVKESMMEVSIAASPLLEDGSLKIRASNSKDNKLPQMYTVIQDDRELAQSGSVAPGKKLDAIDAPEAHAGEAIVRIQALDKDGAGPHGSPTEVAVTIREERE